MFGLFYGWPNGLVWGNVAAEPIIAALTLLVMWPFRHHLMRRFVRFHRGHHEAVLQEERQEWADIMRLMVAGHKITEEQALELFAFKYGSATELQNGPGSDEPR